MDLSLFKVVFENLSIGIAVVDDSYKILQHNKIFSTYFNLKSDSFLVKLDKLHPTFAEQPLSAFQIKTRFTTLEKKALSVSTKVLKEKLWVVEVEDISAQEKENNDIHFRANYDQLTRLPNRELFTDRCKQVLSSTHRHKENIAIFFIDVDNFKSINDTYGHNIGDSILMETGKQLTALVRESDTVARWGGDEFSVLLPKIGEKADINQLLKRIIKKFEVSQQIEEFTIPVSLSIGISLSPTMGTDFDELMRFADKGMYEAKKNNAIHYKYYSE